MKWRSIEKGAASGLRHIQFFPRRVEDHPQDRPALKLKPDGDAVGWIPVCEVGGAVQRVDYPLVGRLGLLPKPAFLRQEAVRRISSSDQGDDGLLSPSVRIRDQVDRILVFDAESVAGMLQQNRPGMPSCLDGCGFEFASCRSSSEWIGLHGRIIPRRPLRISTKNAVMDSRRPKKEY